MNINIYKGLISKNYSFDPTIRTIKLTGQASKVDEIKQFCKPPPVSLTLEIQDSKGVILKQISFTTIEFNLNRFGKLGYGLMQWESQLRSFWRKSKYLPRKQKKQLRKFIVDDFALLLWVRDSTS